jgi:hypothetical protein
LPSVETYRNLTTIAWAGCLLKQYSISNKIQEMLVTSHTLNGSLSVLKLMPGTYFNQTGKPLQNCVPTEVKGQLQFAHTQKRK